MRRALGWLFLLSCLACSRSRAEPRASTDASSQRYAGAPLPPALPRALAQPVAPVRTEDAGDARPLQRMPIEKQPASGCGLELRAEAEVLKSGRISLRASVHNTGAGDVTLRFAGRCPEGPVDFLGLAPGYDFYHACNKGACAGPQQPITVRIARGKSSELARLELDPRGGSCAAKLEPGSYNLLPRLTAASPKICKTTPATFRLGARAAAEVARPAGDPQACQGADECVLSCPNVRGCCGHPCGCQHALNRAFLAAYEAEYARTCEKPPCPAVGCMRKDASGVTCRNGRCAAVDSLTF